MQNSKITMKELLYKMACYQELYPNVHLFEKTDLNIEKVVLLDRVQKGYFITKEQSNFLKKDNLIEGRYPRIYVSSNIAEIVGEKLKYMDNKGLANSFYRDYIYI